MSHLVDDALAMVDGKGVIAAMKWLAEAAAKAEREECAALCSYVAAGVDSEVIESAIRARGEK